jgi:hypothetical protein
MEWWRGLLVLAVYALVYWILWNNDDRLKGDDDGTDL